MNWINLLLGNKGRIARKPYLIGLLPILLLFALLALYLKYLTGILPSWANIAIPVFIALEALYFTANLSIKRLHDFGRSAHSLWLLFSPLIIAGIFLFQQKYIKLASQEWAVLIYTLLISLALIGFFWMLIAMLFRRSDEHENKYGPSPGAEKV